MDKQSTSTEQRSQLTAGDRTGRRTDGDGQFPVSLSEPILHDRRIRRAAGTEHPVATGGGTSWTRLTGFQRDLTKCIRSIEEEEETIPTGKTIQAEIEAMYGEAINHGRLYQNLNHLVERECIDKVVVDGRTNAYYLTDGARGMLDDAAMDFVETCEIRSISSEP